MHSRARQREREQPPGGHHCGRADALTPGCGGGGLQRLEWTRRIRRAVASAAPVGELFSRQYGWATILLTATYFAQIMVFYFIQKWIPKIVVDMGHTPAEAGAVLVSANIGCLLGALAIGMASLCHRRGAWGAALGPMAAGALLSWGYGLKLVSVVMGSGALAAAIFLLLLARLQASAPVNR